MHPCVAIYHCNWVWMNYLHAFYNNNQLSLYCCIVTGPIFLSFVAAFLQENLFVSNKEYYWLTNHCLLSQPACFRFSGHTLAIQLNAIFKAKMTTKTYKDTDNSVCVLRKWYSVCHTLTLARPRATTGHIWSWPVVEALILRLDCKNLLSHFNMHNNLLTISQINSPLKPWNSKCP